jgi:GNAT superfamily N-acetyltransferase
MNEILQSTTPLEREIFLRDATSADARSLAELIAIAGAGIPQWLWAQMAGPNEDVLDVGIRRAKRDEGGFSWTNAVVAEVDGSVIGMILGYRLEDEEDEDLEQFPDILRPFLELERRVPGSWYINAFALYNPWRGRGIGTRLLAAASERARSLGCRQMSVQTFSETPRSEAFYNRHRFRRLDTRRLPTPSPCHHGGDTVLLLRNEEPLDE